MKLYRSSLLALACALAVACDPSDPSADAAGEAENETTLPLREDQISGTYLYVVSTAIAPRIPTVYLAEIEAEQMKDSYKLRIRQRPLSRSDRFTPVAPWGDWRESTLDADGTIQSVPVRAMVPAAANAVSGFDTESEILMIGHLYDRETSMNGAPIEFFCGDIEGRILNPFPVDNLRGTFTATRIEDPNDQESFPPLVINCNHDPARPL